MADLQAAYIDTLGNTATNQGRLLTDQADRVAKAGVQKAEALGATIGSATGALEDYSKIKDAQDQNQFITQAFQQAGGDADAAIKAIQVKYPQAAFALGKQLGEMREATAKGLKEEADAHKAQLDYVMKMVQGVPDNDPAALEAIRPTIARVAPDIAATLPPAKNWSADTKAQFLGIGQTTQEYLNRRDAAVTALREGKGMSGIAYLLSTAGDQDEWNTILNLGKQYLSPAQLSVFGDTWSKEAQQRAGQMATTADQAADNAREDKRLVMQQQEAASRMKNDTARTQATVAREARLAKAASDAAAGGDDKVMVRDARKWRAEEVGKLNDALRGTGDGLLAEPPITQEEYKQRMAQIDQIYNQWITNAGIAVPEDDTTPPEVATTPATALPETQEWTVDSMGRPVKKPVPQKAPGKDVRLPALSLSKESDKKAVRERVIDALSQLRGPNGERVEPTPANIAAFLKSQKNRQLLGIAD